MSCADVCLYADYDGNGPEFCVEKVVRAAKPHRCCECGDPIARGEQHQAVSGKWDGEMATFRTCLACVEIRAVFCCNGWAYGTLWEDIGDQLFPDWNANLMGVECLARLKTEPADRKMRERFARWTEKNQ